MKESRTKKTKRNILYSLMDSSLTIGFQFVSRSIIIYCFGSQYLGLSGLFASILQVLNMADLGFSAAIIYNMYKPIALHDIDAVCSLLNYYRKVYRIVGAIILVCGAAIIPVIPHLIKGEYPKEINIYILYLLYLGNSVISYFFGAYKAALLNALQRLDLTKIAYIIVNLIQYILQVVALVVLRNFYLYVCLTILGTIFKNIFCAYVSRRKFPQYVCRGVVSNVTKKDIKSRVKGLLICNISGATYTTFDSIILSSFVGLSTVAIYNNYIVVFNGVMSFVLLIRGAMQSSVGDSIAAESHEKNYQDMLLWQFFYSVIAIWCVTCLLNLYQPFMNLWMGSDMMLPMDDVVLLCIWFFLSVVQNAFFLYLSGNGLWWEMRLPYILSTLCNLIFNIILGRLYGITGVIFSTVFASFIFGMIWQCSIIFRCYFIGKNPWKYFGKQLFYFTICILSCNLAYFINRMILVDGIGGLLINTVICTFATMLVVMISCSNLAIYKRAKAFIFFIIEK